MTTAFPRGSNGQPGFIMLDMEFFEAARELRLSFSARALYEILLAHVNRATGLCFPGQARLAALMGRSLKTVYNGLSELKRLGFLAIERTRRVSGHYGGNRYKLGIPLGEKSSFEASEAPEADAIDCIPPSKENTMNGSAVAALLAKAKQNAADKHNASVAKKAAKLSLVKNDDLTPEQVMAAEEIAASAAQTAPVAKPLNSNDVRAWFDDARKAHWPDLKFLPPWTMKDMALAKKLLEAYPDSGESLKKMVFHLFARRLQLKCSGVPTPGFLWAVQSRLYGEIQPGGVANGGTPSHNGSGGGGWGKKTKAEHLMKGEWDDSHSMTGGKGGVVPFSDIMKKIGWD